MTKEDEREQAIQDYRNAIEMSIENDERNGLYGYNSTRNATEAERLRERGVQLDENERIAKERYDSLGCQESTGVSSDGYRHKVVEEMRQKELREKKRAEIQARMQTSNSNTNHL